MNTNPIICIPRTNITDKKFIFKIFKHFGNIKIINASDGKVFIYFNYWYIKKPIVKKILNLLNTASFVNIIYEFPWFWRCVIKNQF